MWICEKGKIWMSWSDGREWIGINKVTRQLELHNDLKKIKEINKSYKNML
tara:strand:- start:1 stop:150 length:150 start_codon:yes stop_codon:yes gene_type:complete